MASGMASEEQEPSQRSHPLLDQLRGKQSLYSLLTCARPCGAAGIVYRLKAAPQPIKDGHSHLTPFCETLEAIFRHGLKREWVDVERKGMRVTGLVCFSVCASILPEPNSLFGLNRRDYWCWIEPLQDYYFNEKYDSVSVTVDPHLLLCTLLFTLRQNPLLRKMVQDIGQSHKVIVYVGGVCPLSHLILLGRYGHSRAVVGASSGFPCATS